MEDGRTKLRLIAHRKRRNFRERAPKGASKRLPHATNWTKLRLEDDEVTVGSLDDVSDLSPSFEGGVSRALSTLVGKEWPTKLVKDFSSFGGAFLTSNRTQPCLLGLCAGGHNAPDIALESILGLYREAEGLERVSWQRRYERHRGEIQSPTPDG